MKLFAFLRSFVTRSHDVLLTFLSAHSQTNMTQRTNFHHADGLLFGKNMVEVADRCMEITYGTLDHEQSL